MNNFDMVFQAVKNLETDKKNKLVFPENIARQTNLRIDRVEFYLNCLEQVGVVKFDNNKTIQLTQEGRNKEKVFLG